MNSHARTLLRPLGKALLACLAAAGHASLLAQIYVSAEGAGTSLVLSNFPSDEAPQILIGKPTPIVAIPNTATTQGLAVPPAVALRMPAVPVELRRVIDEVAAQVQISPELLHAVIATESGYDIRAVSPRGAIGLMQLLPTTAKRFGARDPYAPRDNVMAGASYLKWLMALFENDLELVLAAYNAGEQAVLKAGHRIPPFAETQAYVPRVLAYLRCAGSTVCKPA